MKREGFLLTVLTLIVLLPKLPNIAAAQLPGDFSRGAQYAIASTAFWYASFNTWNKGGDADTRSIRLLQGKVLYLDVWLQDLRETKGERIYFARPSASARQPALDLEITICYEGSKLTFAGPGTKPEASVRVATGIPVKVPADLRAIAGRFGSHKARDLEVIKAGLAGYLGKWTDSTNTQHVFIGPFNELSVDLIMYWVEKKCFIQTGFPADGKAETFSQIVRLARLTDAENEVGRNVPLSKDPLCADIVRATWLNTWLANCVHAGALVEVPLQARSPEPLKK